MDQGAATTQCTLACKHRSTAKTKPVVFVFSQHPPQCLHISTLCFMPRESTFVRCCMFTHPNTRYIIFRNMRNWKHNATYRFDILVILGLLDKLRCWLVLLTTMKVLFNTLQQRAAMTQNRNAPSKYTLQYVITKTRILKRTDSTHRKVWPCRVYGQPREKVHSLGERTFALREERFSQSLGFLWI